MTFRKRRRIILRINARIDKLATIALLIESLVNEFKLSILQQLCIAFTTHAHDDDNAVAVVAWIE